MKSKHYLFLMAFTLLFVTGSMAQPRIAVLNFNAGVGIPQSDVDGLSAIFNTYFEPKGYTVVERTRVSRILEEHNMQGSKITEKEMTKLGELLNVPVIVIGDVNRAMGQYNIDVRAVNVETGAIIAKDGAEWAEGTSYRATMRTIAERMSASIPLVEFTRPPVVTPEPVVKKIDPTYRPTGNSLRFTAGFPDIIAGIAYNHYFTPSFMLGAGTGFGSGRRSTYYDFGDIIPAIPVYLESELRTPRYKWSLFVNAKLGFDISLDYHNDFRPLFASLSVGASYKNINIGVGVSTAYLFVGSISYNFPFEIIKKAFY